MAVRFWLSNMRGQNTNHSKQLYETHTWCSGVHQGKNTTWNAHGVAKPPIVARIEIGHAANRATG